jgi:ferredoxin
MQRGHRLRCTSCHSQIVQGEHVAVKWNMKASCLRTIHTWK